MKQKLSDYGINGDDNSKEYSNPKTAVEWLWDMLSKGEFINDPEELFNQAKAKERSQKAEEYLKGFKDGKEYQIKLDELTFKSE